MTSVGEMIVSSTERPKGWPLEITVRRQHDGTPVVTAGKYSTGNYLLLPKAKKEVLKMAHLFIEEPPPLRHVLLPGYDTDDRGYRKKRWNTDAIKNNWVWLGEHLGYNFSVAWNKIQYREWVAPHHNIIYKLCFGPVHRGQALTLSKARYPRPLGYDEWSLRRFWLNREQILQLESDGILNLAPLIMRFYPHGATPKSLKEYYGNGLWKKLCQQSLTRNKMLSHYGREDVSTLVDYPSTVLKRLNTDRALMATHPAIFKEVMKRKKERKLYTLDQTTLYRMVHVVNDAERMARDLEVNFSDGWSYDRINALHQELSLEYQRLATARWAERDKRRMGENPFKKVNGPGTVEGEKYDIIYLDSVDKIAEEGREMHHCVGSYAIPAAAGDCSIYSVRDKEGNRVTTLQVHGDGRVGQHYGKYNATPDSEVKNYVEDTVRLHHYKNHDLGK